MVTTLELAANGLTTASIILAGRNRIHTWWTGAVGCLLFGFVFYDARLYADVLLQGFFVVTSLIGWEQWLRGNRGTDLPVSVGGRRMLLQASLIGIVTSLAYGALLQQFTDAYAPFVDSAVLAFSVVAQILMMRRKIENWMFWLLVNSISVPLYASRGLYMTSGLYCVYWVNACVAWFYWRREMLRQAAS